MTSEPSSSVLADTDSVLELRAGFGHGHGHGAGQDRGPARRRGGQQPGPPGRGHRPRRGGQGGPVPPALRRPRHPDPVPVRHPRASWSDPRPSRPRQVRHFSRLFVVGASLTVPVLHHRRAQGVRARVPRPWPGGASATPIFIVAWPTGELGGMGLEGAVRLGFRRELDAVEDPAEREALFERMVERAYRHGKALNVASAFEIDDVIDPVDSRRRDRRSPAVGPTSARAEREEAQLHRHLVILRWCRPLWRSSRSVGDAAPRWRGGGRCPGPPTWAPRWPPWTPPGHRGWRSPTTGGRRGRSLPRGTAPGARRVGA